VTLVRNLCEPAEIGRHVYFLLFFTFVLALKSRRPQAAVSKHPDPVLVREHLRKILGSPAFAHSARMSRFLQFALERALEGRAAEVKEYVIGVEVFDRSPSFDPRVDPIVRVEARRLRAKLKKYYEAEGKEDAVIIGLPTGTYTPSIRLRVESAPCPEPGATMPANSIAVLPFVNLSPEADSEYFSDGLTEELNHALTKLPGLRVVSWRSAAQWKDRQSDLRETGRQLQVSSLVVGSVRRAGSRLRVIAQLLDAATGQCLWSETYDRQMADLFAIQEEISASIVRSLKLRLTTAPVSTGHSQTDIATYDLYLRGRFHWNRRTPESLGRAVQLFEQVIELDPQFAPAHAGLADALSLHADYGLACPIDLIPRARAAALRAIEIDPDQAEAYCSLGLISSFYDWNWEQSEQYYLRSIELNQNYTTAHHWYGTDMLALRGRFDEALAEMQIALRLDPFSLPLNESRAYVLMLAGRLEEALARHRETLDLDPHYYKTYNAIGRVYIQMGMYGRAIEMLDKGRSLESDVPSAMGALGQAYALDGRHQEARALLTRLEEMARERFVGCTTLALIHCGLGEHERALDWLENAVRRREFALSAIGVHPAYDSLRGHPRFQAILRQIGLAGG
jgi:serine/threonine-protein kinase